MCLYLTKFPMPFYLYVQLSNNVFYFMKLQLDYAVLYTFPAILDIFLSWKARKVMSLHVQLRYIFKAILAAAWVIILPVTYAYSWKNPSGFAQTIKNWFGNGTGSPSLFILAVFIYLSPNILSALLFVFPFIRQFLERSNNGVVKLMMWWSQVKRCISGLCIYSHIFCNDTCIFS